MDNLQELIKNLNEKESNEFKKFIALQYAKENRKDINLFNKMRGDDFDAGKLFNLKQKNQIEQYQALRKRLYYALTEFIALKYKDNDLSGTGNLLNTIKVCRYLFENNIHRLAWKYLLKAEQKAINEENYVVLNSLYLLMLDYAHTPYALALTEIKRRKKIAKKLCDEDELITEYLAEAKDKLKTVKITADTQEFTEYIEHLQNLPFISKRPAAVFALTEIVRNAYLAQRMLANFEHYIEEQYDKFNAITGNQAKWHSYKLRLLYMLCHIYYRNRKFSNCLKKLTLLKEEINRYPIKEKNKYYGLYISLLSSVYSLTGKNVSAITIQEEYLHMFVSKNDENYLNMCLNLVFYYFNAAQFKKANALLIQMYHSDDWYEKKMGKEWVMRKKLITCIVQYELGHDDLAIKTLHSLSKRYSSLFDLALYNKAKIFVSILKNYFENPNAFTVKDFEKLSLNKIFLTTAEQEEPKSIAFYCWLKAKIKKVDYYSLLLKEIKRKGFE